MSQQTQAQALASHAAAKLARSPAYQAAEKQRDLLAQQMLEEIASGDNVVVEASELERLRALEAPEESASDEASED
jgi:hypothetical protein